MNRSEVRLPPDVFEAIVTAVARTLAATYRSHWQQPVPSADKPVDRVASVSTCYRVPPRMDGAVVRGDLGFVRSLG